jgi:hypothetical protein
VPNADFNRVGRILSSSGCTKAAIVVADLAESSNLRFSQPLNLAESTRMSFFGSQRDDRRRRTLAEESAGDSIASVAPVANASKPAGKTPRYANPARRENHRPVSDLIPRRGIAFGICYFIGLLLVAGLLAGSILSESDSASTASFAPLFDLVRGSSLLGWFSSVMFGIAAAGSVLVYSIRRHKVDDYRGRYRLWLWSAAAWLVMSIDATANIHSPFAQGMALATGWTLSGDTAIWWIGVWGAVLSILGLRLTFETRECRTAMFAYLTVAACWLAALCVELELVAFGAHATLVAAGCRLVGQITLLFATCIYARHVLLDAEGLITIRPLKPKREKKKKVREAKAESDSGDSDKKLRVDASHKSPPKQTDLQTTSYVTSNSFPANRSTSRNEDDSDDEDRSQNRRGSQSRYDEEEDDDSSSSGNRKLSKAERKRLRKQRRNDDDDE